MGSLEVYNHVYKGRPIILVCTFFYHTALGLHKNLDLIGLWFHQAKATKL
jgi:hypothetical protein